MMLTEPQTSKAVAEAMSVSSCRSYFAKGILVLLSLALSGCWEEPDVDIGTRFFRMVVKFEYKGEPQAYDYVVGCHVPDVVDPKTGEKRFAGFIPDIYGHKMKDGKAVVVKTPDFCAGQTNTTGEIQPGNQIGPKVPESFMPFIVVYDNADRMDQGLGYISGDAYDSPYSDLKFISTRVTAATRADFDKDGIEGQPNVVTRELYWAAQHPTISKSMGLEELRPLRAAGCIYFERYRIPDRYRAEARKRKPKGNFTFWVPTLEDERQWINSLNLFRFEWSEIPYTPTQAEAAEESPGNGRTMILRHSRFFDYGMARRGLNAQTRTDGGWQDTWKNLPIIAYYPVFSEITDRNWPVSYDDFIQRFPNPVAMQVKFEDGKWRGFVSCYSAPLNLFVGLDATTNEGAQAWRDKMDKANFRLQVDNEQAYVPVPRLLMLKSVSFMIENDQFLWYRTDFNFSAPGGDVR